MDNDNDLQKQAVSNAAKELGKLSASKAGKARWANKTEEERKEWGAKMTEARRVEINFFPCTGIMIINIKSESCIH